MDFVAPSSNRSCNISISNSLHHRQASHHPSNRSSLHPSPNLSILVSPTVSVYMVTPRPRNRVKTLNHTTAQLPRVATSSRLEI